MTNQLEEKRGYTSRQYTVEQVSQAISLFIQEGGSIARVQKALKIDWGYSPTEPTIRKWLQSSNEAMNLLDQRTVMNLQADVAHIIELSYDLLVNELQSGNFPASKLGTLYGIMVDKYILLNKIRNDSVQRNASNNDIIADELLTDKTDMLEALLNDPQLALTN